MGIKDILEKYNREKEIVSEEKNQEQNKLQASEERAKNLISNIIDKAFQHIKDEFESFGDERKAIVDTRPGYFYSAITITNQDIKEFYYELNVHLDENSIWIKVVHHYMKYNGTFNYVPEYDLVLSKPVSELTEEDIRNDFYQKYEQYLNFRVKY